MNWKEISEKYPKVWNIFKNKDYKSIFLEAEMMFPSLPSPVKYSLRDLYDFFDENDIMVFVMSSNAVFSYYVKDSICAHVDGNYIYDPDTDEAYKTPYPYTWDDRSKAEEAAFIKAFEILEKK